MNVLITGANGFVAQNLRAHLFERSDVNVYCFTRENTLSELKEMIKDVDFVFHLAGVNRPDDPLEFVRGNVDLTQCICDELRTVTEETSKCIPVILSSSIQADRDNPYGKSKLAAENALIQLKQDVGNPVYIFRLPNVFGKWCRPNYNSAVATFCHNVARGMPIQIHDSSARLSLVYVDDVVESFIGIMDGGEATFDDAGLSVVNTQYQSTVGEVASYIQSFKSSRETLMAERVGSGLVRALYSTYVSYLPKDDFVYALPQHQDARGSFVEMLKTPDCGQFSFFTAFPGVTRGGHYHHTKTEKFLVIKGNARFKFRHILTGESHELVVTGAESKVVETVPGWTHDITNIGQDELVVMLWANEVFDRDKPDTYACSL